MSIKVLIIRFSSIGDIVLTSPIARCLKKQVEDIEIHYVTKEQYLPLVKPNPYIDKVHLFSDNFNDLTKTLIDEEYDYIIDLHNNLRSRFIKNRLNVTAFRVNKLNIYKYLLVNFKINCLPDSHIVDRNLDTLKVFNVVNDGGGLDFFIPEGEGNLENILPASHKEGYIAFVIAGAWATKRLPADKVIALCNQIDFPVVLLGGEDQKDEGELILSQTEGDVINLCGVTDIYQSAAVVRDARVVLTNDTGLMHIAAAFKKKILTFWGNTVREFGMYPYLPDPDSVNFEVDGLKCRPCSKLGYNRCPKGHFRCMNEQNVELAVQWIKQKF